MDKSMTLLGLAKGKKHTRKKHIPHRQIFIVSVFLSTYLYFFFYYYFKKKKPTVPLHHCYQTLCSLLCNFFVKLKRCQSSLTGTLPSASADKACVRACVRLCRSMVTPIDYNNVVPNFSPNVI